MGLAISIGLMAAILTTGSFLPQVIKTIQTKHTKDLSLLTYSTLTSGIVLWLIYGVMIRDVPIIVANCISMVLCGTILACKIRYK